MDIRMIKGTQTFWSSGDPSEGGRSVRGEGVREWGEDTKLWYSWL